MNDFIARYQDQLNGVPSGFDRLVFRGNLPLNHEAGMKGYLWAHGLGLKDFGEHAEQISVRTKEASLAMMETAGRPVHYLNSGKYDKQQMARAIATADGIVNGPICALKGCGVVFQLCYPGQPRRTKTPTGAQLSQVFVPLSILDAPAVRLHERPVADVVPVSHSHLPQRARMAGAADGSSRNPLPPPRQLFHLG